MQSLVWAILAKVYNQAQDLLGLSLHKRARQPGHGIELGFRKQPQLHKNLHVADLKVQHIGGRRHLLGVDLTRPRLGSTKKLGLELGLLITCKFLPYPVPAAPTTVTTHVTQVEQSTGELRLGSDGNMNHQTELFTSCSRQPMTALDESPTRSVHSCSSHLPQNCPASCDCIVQSLATDQAQQTRNDPQVQNPVNMRMWHMRSGKDPRTICHRCGTFSEPGFCLLMPCCVCLRPGWSHRPSPHHHPCLPWPALAWALPHKMKKAHMAHVKCLGSGTGTSSE